MHLLWPGLLNFFSVRKPTPLHVTYAQESERKRERRQARKARREEKAAKRERAELTGVELVDDDDDGNEDEDEDEVEDDEESLQIPKRSRMSII